MQTMPSHATTAEHLALAPPKSGHWGLPAGMAVGVHALLAAALAWGVSWRDEPQLTAVSAELWSRLPQEAAPLPVTPPPPPKPEESSPTPPPPAPQPKAQAQENADIAMRQREKARREREEALRLEQERKETIAKEKAAKEKAAQAAKDKAKAEEARKQAEQKKQQLAQQKADADKKQREEALRKERADAKQAEARKKAEQAALDKTNKSSGKWHSSAAPADQEALARRRNPAARRPVMVPKWRRASGPTSASTTICQATRWWKCGSAPHPMAPSFLVRSTKPVAIRPGTKPRCVPSIAQAHCPETPTDASHRTSSSNCAPKNSEWRGR